MKQSRMARKFQLNNNFTKNRNTIKMRSVEENCFRCLLLRLESASGGQRLVSHYTQLPLTDRMSSSQTKPNSQATRQPVKRSVHRGAKKSHSENDFLDLTTIAHKQV